ncbi:MAG: hypothetical protein WA004_18715 [Saprospiraceae bacterium]
MSELTEKLRDLLAERQVQLQSVLYPGSNFYLGANEDSVYIYESAGNSPAL